MFASDYTVRYRLSGGNGGYTTVNISGTRVTLRGLAPNAVYDVEVAAINSNGVFSDFSAMSQFIVTPTTAVAPSKLLLPSTVIKYIYAHICTISITDQVGKLCGQHRVCSYSIASQKMRPTSTLSLHCLIGPPPRWKAPSKNTTPHQQHWANSVQKSPRQPLVHDWLAIPETLMLNRHRLKYKGRFVQGRIKIH